MVARGRTSAVTWNADGTAAPLRREFKYQGKLYRTTISPAYIDQPDGSLRAEFPGIKEEMLELVLTKLAMDRGYFTDTKDGSPSADSFVLITSINQIAEELKRTRGPSGSKTRTYSHPQIRDALHVLAKTKIHLRSDNDDDLIFSPIADFGAFNAKSAEAQANNLGKATLYIRFNALISQAILSRSWRQINYERILSSDQFLVRRLRKLLSLRFTYAAPNKTFNILLSTIIENSGVTLYQRLSDNLKMVEKAVAAMPDVIDRIAIEKSR